MSFEELNLDHLTEKGEKVYGNKPNPEEIRRKLEEAIRADAELAARLSKKENASLPGPATISPEIAREYGDELGEVEGKEGRLIEFPTKKKPEEMEELEKKKAA